MQNFDPRETDLYEELVDLGIDNEELLHNRNNIIIYSHYFDPQAPQLYILNVFVHDILSTIQALTDDKIEELANTLKSVSPKYFSTLDVVLQHSSSIILRTNCLSKLMSILSGTMSNLEAPAIIHDICQQRANVFLQNPIITAIINDNVHLFYVQLNQLIQQGIDIEKFYIQIPHYLVTTMSISDCVIAFNSKQIYQFINTDPTCEPLRLHLVRSLPFAATSIDSFNTFVPIISELASDQTLDDQFSFSEIFLSFTLFAIGSHLPHAIPDIIETNFIPTRFKFGPQEGIILKTHAASCINVPALQFLSATVPDPVPIYAMWGLFEQFNQTEILSDLVFLIDFPSTVYLYPYPFGPDEYHITSHSINYRHPFVPIFEFDPLTPEEILYSRIFQLIPLGDISKILHMRKEKCQAVFDVILADITLHRGKGQAEFGDFEADYLALHAQTNLGVNATARLMVHAEDLSYAPPIPYYRARKVAAEHHLLKPRIPHPTPDHSHLFVAKAVGLIWHTDLKGPLHIEYYPADGPEFHKGSMLCAFIDDKSRYVVHAEIVPNKHSATIAQALDHAVVAAQAKTPAWLTSDNGGEFVGNPFQRTLAKYNIKHFRTQPRTPQQNGKIESWWRNYTSRVTAEQKPTLQAVIDGFNQTVHNTTRIAPSIMWQREEWRRVDELAGCDFDDVHNLIIYKDDNPARFADYHRLPQSKKHFE